MQATDDHDKPKTAREFLDLVADLSGYRRDDLTLDLELVRHLNEWDEDQEDFLESLLDRAPANFKNYDLSLYGKEPSWRVFPNIEGGRLKLGAAISITATASVLFGPIAAITAATSPAGLLSAIVYWPLLYLCLTFFGRDRPHDLPTPVSVTELPATYTPVTLGDLWEAVQKSGWPPDGWDETVAHRRDALIAERAAAGLDEFGRRRG